MASVKKQRLYLGLNRFAAFQILVGVASVVLSVAAVGTHASDFPAIEEQNGSVVKYVILGLDIGAAVSSLWFVFSGSVPIYMTRKKRSVIKTKGWFMFCCILSASVFVPLVFGAAIASVILRRINDNKMLVLPGLMAVVSLVEMIIAITASVYCCRSEWAECRLNDTSNDIEEIKVSNDNDDKKCGWAKWKQGKEEKKIAKKEKRRQKRTKKERVVVASEEEEKKNIDPPPPYSI